MTDPFGPGRGSDPPRRALSRSSLWDDEDRGEGVPVGPQPLRARWDPVPPSRQEIPTGRRRRRRRRRSRVGWFLHRYGWRAYAIPVLVALTVVAVLSVIRSPGPQPDQGASMAGGGLVTITIGSSVMTTVTKSGANVTETIGRPVDRPPAGSAASGEVGPLRVADATIAPTIPPVPDVAAGDAFEGVVMGVLPPGSVYARTGAGTFHVIPGTSARFGSGSDHYTFTIEAEDGIGPESADQAFAAAVMSVLSDPQSWIGGKNITLQRIDSGDPDFKITLTSSMTTRKEGYCGWGIQLEASCYNHAVGRVIINDARWVRGSYVYHGDLTSYRVYAINHEVGHALGHHHLPCPVDDGVAPVMMQQSWSTSDDDLATLNDGGPVPADGKVCRANPFPFPPGD